VRERLTIVGIALFVALDLVLVTLSFRHMQAPPTSDDRAASSSASPTPSPETPSTATARPSPARASTGKKPDPGAATAFLGVGDDRTLLRASQGSCAGGTDAAQVAVSDDDGKSFDPTRVPGLTEVLGIRAASATDLTVIGLGSGCKVSRFSSTDGGGSWTRAAGGGSTWHLDPAADSDTVASPAGSRTAPCAPVALSTLQESLVRLLCDDGKVLGTDDSGDTWVTLGSLPGAVDIRFTSAGVGVALAKQEGCPAAVMQSVDGGARWTRLGCLPGAEPRAIGSMGSTIAAQVGDQLYVSSDGGKSWPGPAGG
jgi:photosystem II stability/assembly factor-like uncharacterized protein